MEAPPPAPPIAMEGGEVGPDKPGAPPPQAYAIILVIDEGQLVPTVKVPGEVYTETPFMALATSAVRALPLPEKLVAVTIPAFTFLLLSITVVPEI